PAPVAAYYITAGRGNATPAARKTSASGPSAAALLDREGGRDRQEELQQGIELRRQRRVLLPGSLPGPVDQQAVVLPAAGHVGDFRRPGLHLGDQLHELL